MPPKAQPRTTGARLPSISHYAPPVILDEETFRRKFRNCLDKEFIPYPPDDVISELYRITGAAASGLALKKQQQTPTAQQDLKSRGELIETLRSHVDESLEVLEEYRKRGVPLTSRLIRPLRREFLQLRKDLARADVQYRADEVIVKYVKRSFPTDLSLTIDKCLRAEVPQLKSQDERNIVIAGCLVAGGLYSEKQLKKVISTMPMQLSRARRRANRVAHVDFRSRSKKNVDDYCSRCKGSTCHVVLALEGGEVETVRCVTCESEHEYRHNTTAVSTDSAGPLS